MVFWAWERNGECDARSPPEALLRSEGGAVVSRSLIHVVDCIFQGDLLPFREGCLGGEGNGQIRTPDIA
jgi:hypothetical protein